MKKCSSFLLISFLLSLNVDVTANDLASNGVIVPSNLVQGCLVVATVAPGYSVNYKGKPLKINDNGTFILGLGRDAGEMMRLVVVDDKGHQKEYTFPVAKRKYNIQSVEGVPQRTVTPNPEDIARIRQDSLLVRNARQGVSDRQDFLAGFIKPLEGPVTGVYGSQRVYNGTPKNPHYGVDYAAPTGTIVRAPAAGVVQLAHSDLFYSGGTLIMDHGFGLNSSFLHLSAVLVLEGQEVKQGDPIGKVGSTGRATGPHLDWRMNWLNVRIDPQLVMESLPAE
ncbi:MAG: M23 family metallopeptidase [Porticoccaceae bacterium]|nr:M23 family metallopeptidase [Porticoccaceae bacterium]